MHRIGNGLTLILVLLCSGAAGLLYSLQQDPSLGVVAAAPRVAETDAGVPASETLATPEATRIVRSMVDTELLLERPLFTSGRRPPELPESADPEIEEQVFVQFSYVLEGVATRGKERIALLRSRSGQEFRRLGEGEELNGWTLVRVDPRQAELENDGRRLVLEMNPSQSQGGSNVQWQRVE